MTKSRIFLSRDHILLRSNPLKWNRWDSRKSKYLIKNIDQNKVTKCCYLMVNRGITQRILRYNVEYPHLGDRLKNIPPETHRLSSTPSVFHRNKHTKLTTGYRPASVEFHIGGTHHSSLSDMKVSPLRTLGRLLTSLWSPSSFCLPKLSGVFGDASPSSSAWEIVLLVGPTGWIGRRISFPNLSGRGICGGRLIKGFSP